MENNPLKQFFRRPSVYFKLPSGGKNYAPGVLDLPESGELPVYPMTAIDEITVKTPDALFNGTAIVDIIRSCIPNIKDPWSIVSDDLDSIMVVIRTATNGSDLEIESSCPKCDSTSNFVTPLMNLLSTVVPADYDTELTLGDLSFKFKPLTYKEMNEAALKQLELQRAFVAIDAIEDMQEKARVSKGAIESATMLTMEILAKTIQYIKTPTMEVGEFEFIIDYLKNCDKNSFETVRDYNASLKENTSIKPMEITCVDCGNQYKQSISLNPADFFA